MAANIINIMDYSDKKYISIYDVINNINIQLSLKSKGESAARLSTLLRENSNVKYYKRDIYNLSVSETDFAFHFNIISAFCKEGFYSVLNENEQNEIYHLTSNDFYDSPSPLYLFNRAEIEKICDIKMLEAETLNHFDLIGEPMRIRGDDNTQRDLKNKVSNLQKELEIKEAEIRQLQQKNKKLQEEIAYLKSDKDLPIFLNEFMENDRLLLAIQTRKEYWSNYNPDLNNPPKAEPTVREIQDKFNLSQKQATAIEIVACPINRNLPY